MGQDVPSPRQFELETAGHSFSDPPFLHAHVDDPVGHHFLIALFFDYTSCLPNFILSSILSVVISVDFLSHVSSVYCLQSALESRPVALRDSNN